LEFIVKRKKEPFWIFICFVIGGLGLAVVAFIYKTAGPIAFIVLPGWAALAAPFIRLVVFHKIKLEFEYSLSAGIFGIEKIHNQAKRSPVVKVPVSDITAFGRMSDAGADEWLKKATKVVYCNIEEDNDASYYFICDVDHKGDEMYIFDPNDKLINALKRYNPVILNAFGKVGSFI